MTEAQGYDPQFFRKIAATEERHFWFCTRTRIIGSAVKQVVAGFEPGYRVIEVGCGTGVVLRELVRVCERGHVVGMDLFPEAVSFAREKASCPVFLGDAERPPGLGQFDAVCMFDVLEHLADDRKTLTTLNLMVKPGGALVLTVPAHMSLWSYFDVASCHCRRYAPSRLAKLLQESGFKVEYLTQFMMSLFPLVWLRRRTDDGSAVKDRNRAAEKAANELKVVPVINDLLKLILSIEVVAIRRRWRLPIGTSVLIVARKERTAGDSNSRSSDHQV
jgi:SAM-dependent methyltransferase